jgi:hypothetical protein
LQKRFKTLLEDHGPDEALRIIEIDEIGRAQVTTGTIPAGPLSTDEVWEDLHRFA